MSTTSPAAPDPQRVETQKTEAATWFAELRDRICAAFEAIEDDHAGPFAGRPAGRFERRTWDRPGGRPFRQAVQESWRRSCARS